MNAERVTDALRDLVAALEGAFISSWQSTAAWDSQLTTARAALSAADAVRDGSASGAFAEWLAREMPPGTIISDPLWWAPRIERAIAALRQPVTAQQPAAAVPDMQDFTDAVFAFNDSAIQYGNRTTDANLCALVEARMNLMELYAQALASNAGVPEVTKSDVEDAARKMAVMDSWFGWETAIGCNDTLSGNDPEEERGHYRDLATTALESYRARLIERMKGGGE